MWLLSQLMGQPVPVVPSMLRHPVYTFGVIIFCVYDYRWYTPASMRQTNHSLHFSLLNNSMMLRDKPLHADELEKSVPMDVSCIEIHYTHLSILTHSSNIYDSGRWYQALMRCCKSVPMGVSRTKMHYTHLPFLTLSQIFVIQGPDTRPWWNVENLCRWIFFVPKNITRIILLYTLFSSNKSGKMIQLVILLAGENHETLC